MRSVNIAELKNRLSAYLQVVRGGEEIVIRDRNLPVAKLVPLTPSEASAEEMALVASGQLSLPRRKLNQRALWSIGSRTPVGADAVEAARRAVSEDRDQAHDRLLGR